MATVDPFGLPPEEALKWFRQKRYQLSFDWREVWKEQHAQAFTVARATQLDVLADIREAVDKAIANGQTLAQFRKELRPLLEEKGWWGEAQATDPKTGEKKNVQLGSPRRLRTIYETNLRMAMAAGRWDRIQRTAEARPYLRYVAILDGRERPEHKAWHGTILRHDDPWWETHYPPNDWGCRCKVQQLSERDLERYGYKVSAQAPPVQMRTWANEHTGEVVQVPKGIGPGFDYNVGKAPRSFNPATAKSEIPLEPVERWSDLGRPAAKSVTSRTEAPQLWPRAETVSPGDLRQQFRELFGLKKGDPLQAHITDPQGMRVLLNEGVLKYVVGKKDGREQYFPLVKATVENPFEVWLVPFRKADGRVVMRKRYIGLFKTDDGDPKDMLLVVERYGDGFGAWDVYPKRGIDSQRQGYLLYPSR